jgi:transposase
MNSAAQESLPTYEELQSERASLALLVEQQRAEIQALITQVRSLKTHIFGKKSERFVPDTQSTLFPLPEITSITDKLPPSTPVAAHERVSRKGRKPLSSNLPRERVEHEPETKECSGCGKEMAKIGEEITEQLEYVPARFVIIEHVKIKRACSCCKNEVVQGQLPAGTQVIEKGRAGPGLVTHILVSKYCDHQPLNRLEQIFARHGIEIPRQRMCDWIGVAVEQILLLIAQSLKKSIRGSPYIRVDETGLDVQTAEKIGELHRGQLWGMLSHERDVYFEYASTRGGSVARDLLSGVTACVQSDQLPSYNVLLGEPGVIRVGCWDHVRRKFFDAKESADVHSQAVLKMIGQLYSVEREYKERCKKEKRSISHEERRILRQEKSKLILEDLKKFLDQLALATLPKSPLGKALGYALPQWAQLSVFLDNGIVELSNIGIEQQIRPIALARNNWFYAGNERGATWAAVMFSLIGTCKLNGINPYEYLLDILKRAPTMPRSDIETELTPRAWKAAQKAATKN